ncbi:MAG TPA: hypothetical protein VF043_20815 [Ktedonobacteraceae bacterium]
MSYTIEQVKRAETQTSLAEEVLRVPGNISGNDQMPAIVLTGDIRLRVNESYAALTPVIGHYLLETQGMQEPLHVIWMVEGNVLNHTAHSIDVAFDLRGMSAGETLTRLLSAQVTDCNGQGNIVHCSVFVQISVVKDALIMGDSNTGHQRTKLVEDRVKVSGALEPGF